MSDIEYEHWFQFTKAKDLTGTCRCGHPVAGHQTGEGPWTGFCYATNAGDYSSDCDCERPEPIDELEARALDGDR